MVLKPLEKKCVAGCKGRILEYGNYCECLEKKLNRQSRAFKSVQAQFRNDIERYAEEEKKDTESAFEVAEDEREMEQQLVSYQLKPYQVELVMQKYFFGMTLKEIQEEKGWLAISNVAYHLRKALEALRKRGFKL